MKKILFSTDFSYPAENAFLYATQLAESLKARIDLIHVFSLPFTTALTTSEEQRNDLLQEMSEEAQVKMQQLLERYPSKCVAERKVVYGSFVATEIADAASIGHYDLIVMGMKGEQERVEKWMGSVTTDLMMKAPCPVLAVPAQAKYKDIQKVALDANNQQSENDARAMVQAFTEAQQHKLGFATVLMLGEPAFRFSVAAENYDSEKGMWQTFPLVEGCTGIVLPSLTKLLQQPSLKKNTWQCIKHLRLNSNQ